MTTDTTCVLAPETSLQVSEMREGEKGLGLIFVNNSLPLIRFEGNNKPIISILITLLLYKCQPTNGYCVKLHLFNCFNIRLWDSGETNKILQGS